MSSLSVSELRILDSSGDLAAVFSSGEWGGGKIELFRRGAKIAEMGQVRESLTTISLMDPMGEPGVTISAIGGLGVLQLWSDRQAYFAVGKGSEDDELAMSLQKEGKPLVWLGTVDGDSGGLLLYAGSKRALMFGRDEEVATQLQWKAWNPDVEALSPFAFVVEGDESEHVAPVAE